MTKQEFMYEYSLVLNRALADKDWHRSDLAKVTGLSKVSISKYCRGQSVPNIYNATKIAKVLGWPTCNPIPMIFSQNKRSQ